MIEVKDEILDEEIMFNGVFDLSTILKQFYQI